MKETEEGRTSMCEMMEKMLEKTNAAGRAEGRVEGRAEGRLIQLYELVRKGRLTVIDAAEEASQTEAEFRTGMEAYCSQLESA